VKRATIAVAFVAAAMIAGRATAQTAHPDYSGTWIMQADKSSSDPAPLPTSATWTITNHGDTITVDRTTTLTTGTLQSHVVVATDGKSYDNAVPLSPEITVNTTNIASYDAQGLVVKTSGSLQGSDFVQTDHWTLGADGKSLTSTRVVTVGEQTVQSATMYFTRKP
jgi:hypothetical protein